MNWDGIIIGAATFLCIGAFHPIVIKAEYWLGKRCWWLFALAGVGCMAGSLFSTGILSTLLGVAAFSSLWSIMELFKQAKRVERGWFPRNPRRGQKQSTH